MLILFDVGYNNTRNGVKTDMKLEKYLPEPLEGISFREVKH
jgi:hypothetical protein